MNDPLPYCEFKCLDIKTVPLPFGYSDESTDAEEGRSLAKIYFYIAVNLHKPYWCLVKAVLLYRLRKLYGNREGK